ncbi:MAG: methyltransferase domain-containing protein [Rikenellaceae bacterium]|nr:methyltransferase domain-containing protein [Rikenellaceae bacterium]
MKRLIKFALNHIPRPVVQRMAGWAVPIMGLVYKGHGRECPVCGSRYRKFLPYGYTDAGSRENALCPSCLSLERHRMLWMWLERNTDIMTSLPVVLHVAPEVCLMRKFRRAYKGCPERYITADLESPLADLQMDIQAIPLADQSVDVIFCNHILEHVEDDRLAMREMWRVMRSGGWGVLLSPVDLSLAKTFEDDTITDPEERTRIFGQYDHRRNYGLDYADRLREAGFEVEECDYSAEFTPEERERYGLRREIIYVVRKA